MALTNSEQQRYSQQLKLEQIGLAGQFKLKQARVLCVGAGGLGSAVLLYLAGAGVGTLGIVDADRVELSNLHRQILYREGDLGCAKALAAKEHLLALNANLQVHAYAERFTVENAARLLQDYDLIADCSDNFPTAYCISDCALALNKPSFYASLRQWEGQLAVFPGKAGPCLRCLFPRPPAAPLFPPCIEGGVLGVFPGLLGILQATEILKWILGLSPSPFFFHLVDFLTPRFRRLTFAQDSACSQHKTA